MFVYISSFEVLYYFVKLPTYYDLGMINYILTWYNTVRQIRAEKSESCAILHGSMKLCMVVEGDSKINFRSGATANIFGRSGYLKN